MKNKNFFYQQYEKINWENQEKTKINSFIYRFIIQEIISKKKGSNIKVFDIGFGIGFFIKMLYKNLSPLYKSITIEGCEPSKKNYTYFIKRPLKFRKGVHLKAYHSTFLNTKTDRKFDFVTAVYVFPHFVSEELEKTAKKINLMLEQSGKFILAVASEKYIEEKLSSMKDLFIEKNALELDGKRYKEILHYSDIPRIGKLIDYNREEQFYRDLFEKHGFELEIKKEVNDSGFICTVFVFKKK